MTEVIELTRQEMDVLGRMNRLLIRRRIAGAVVGGVVFIALILACLSANLFDGACKYSDLIMFTLIVLCILLSMTIYFTVKKIRGRGRLNQKIKTLSEDPDFVEALRRADRIIQANNQLLAFSGLFTFDHAGARLTDQPRGWLIDVVIKRVQLIQKQVRGV